FLLTKTGHFHFAQSGHYHVAATGQDSFLTSLAISVKIFLIGKVGNESPLFALVEVFFDENRAIF
ncbi:hypothetical protein COT42_07270, partial [Candidatus Saganbacteria bacterium CG08_land_8_20_14_0_20_45_16]